MKHACRNHRKSPVMGGANMGKHTEPGGVGSRMCKGLGLAAVYIIRGAKSCPTRWKWEAAECRVKTHTAGAKLTPTSEGGARQPNQPSETDHSLDRGAGRDSPSPTPGAPKRSRIRTPSTPPIIYTGCTLTQLLSPQGCFRKEGHEDWQAKKPEAAQARALRVPFSDPL